MIEQAVLKEKMASRIEMYREGIRKAFEGMTYGTKNPDTTTFVKWFELKVREPYWIDAMATFPEGRKMIKRYNDTKAKEWGNGATLG